MRTPSKPPPRPVIYIYRQPRVYQPLVPSGLWKAFQKLWPTKRVLRGSNRPCIWGVHFAQFVYGPLGFETALRQVAGHLPGKWHQHLDRNGRRLVRKQCREIISMINQGTTLPQLRAYYARQSAPGPISLPLAGIKPYQAPYTVVIVP